MSSAPAPVTRRAATTPIGSPNNRRAFLELMRKKAAPSIAWFVVPALLALDAVLAGASGSAAGENADLKQYQWKNRLLLVFAPTRDEPHFLALREAIEARAPGVQDRDLVVFEVLETGPSTVDGDPLEPAAARRLRERLRVPSGTFSLILVGKDGGVKLDRQDRTSLDEVFVLIDSMPMRQREMRREAP